MLSNRTTSRLLTVIALAASLAFPAEECSKPASHGLFQGFIGETTGGPLYIYDWSIPSLPASVPTPLTGVGPLRRSAGGLAVSPDSSKVYVGDSDSDKVMTFDTASLTFSASLLTATGRTRFLAAGPTGRFLYVGAGTGAASALNIFDLTGVLPLLSIPLPSTSGEVAVTPNNTYVVVGLGIAGRGHPHCDASLVSRVRALAGPALRRGDFTGQQARSVHDSRVRPREQRGSGLAGANRLAHTGVRPGLRGVQPSGHEVVLGLLRHQLLGRHPWRDALIASGGLPVPVSGFAFFGPVDVSVTPDGRAAWYRGEPFGSVWVQNAATLAFPNYLSGAEHELNKIVFGKPFLQL